MVGIESESVLSARHWNERMFSFSTTRAPGLRFASGRFVTLGLRVDGRPLMRAYRMASATDDDHFSRGPVQTNPGRLFSRRRGRVRISKSAGLRHERA